METGRVSFKSVVNGFLRTLGQVVQETAIRETSKINQVQEQVEKQKVVAGKELLWRYFPWILVGGITIFLVARYK